MRYAYIACLIACLTIAGLITPALGEDMAVEEGMKVQTAEEVMAAQTVDRVVPSEDALLHSVDKSDRVFTRLENTKLEIVSYFHRRKIGEAIVEKDFIRYMFNLDTGNLIEERRQWREGLPDRVTPAISVESAESLVEGVVTSSRLYIISPESEIFRIKPIPKNPCWVVWSIDGDRHIITVIDAVTGNKLGYGLPPPYEGLSIHGPDHDPPLGEGCDNSDPLWDDHAQNAHNWFETMGYDTQKIGSATGAQIQSHIQSDTTVMFYELDHGGSKSFKNRCEDDIKGTEIETWIADYASMGFAFIGSCLGMCDTGEDTFTEEFRKGLDVDTMVVGYCGMSYVQCKDDCWGDAIAWQTELFTRMNNGHTVGSAYAYANLAFPDCTDQGHICMRIAGDTGLVFGGATYPEVRRSKCGAIYNAFLPAVASRYYTRAHHIRCDSYVPSGNTLTVGTYTSYPYNEVAFVNNSKLTSHGSLVANGEHGEITFVSVKDRRRGMIFSGELNVMNGGEIKIFE